jgi:hypothetical protein
METNDALYDFFCAIVKHGFLQYSEENRNGEMPWIVLSSLLDEDEIVRFSKEYSAIIDFVDKQQFFNLHKTYSLSVRNADLDIFFKELFAYSRLHWRADKPIQFFIFKVFISKFWKLRMRLALKVRKA